MTKKELSQLTDQELLDKAKKLNYASVWKALAIGVMVGVIIWSVAKNTWGFFTLIPLYFIYKMVNNAKKSDALKKEMQKRGLG